MALVIVEQIEKRAGVDDFKWSQTSPVGPAAELLVERLGTNPDVQCAAHCPCAIAFTNIPSFLFLPSFHHYHHHHHHPAYEGQLIVCVKYFFRYYYCASTDSNDPNILMEALGLCLKLSTAWA